MAYRKSFSCLFLIFAAVTALSGQITIRAGISAPTWSAGQGCPTGQFVAGSPDNLHVFKAINLSPGVAGGTQPLWNTNSGAITGDGSCTWKEWGTLGLGAANGSPGNNGVPFLLRTNSPLGTVLDQLVTYDCGNLDTNGFCDVQNLVAGAKNAIGVCIANCGTSGIATIGTYLSAPCTMDGPGTAGDVVAPSPTNPGQCTDEFATTSQINVQTVGRISKANVGGAGSQAQIDFFLGDLNSPGSSSGPGTVSSCGSGVGANAYYPGIGTVVSCDPLITDDGAGHGGMRSLALTDSTVSGNWFEVAGPALPAIASIPIHSFAFSVNPSFGTSYGLEPWDNAPVNGNCISAVTGDATNYFKLHDTGAPCGTGAGTTIQTLGTPNTSQSPLNFQTGPTVSGLTITPSNPSAGNEQMAISGPLPTFSKVPQPATPTATVQGTPGSTTVSWAVVACQDTACAQHTEASAVVTKTTVADPITTTNKDLLSQYRYSANNGTSIRCWNVYRTATNGVTTNTTGLIGTCVSLEFADTGQVGDGTTAPVTNTTVLKSHPQPLPACAAAEGAVFGIDAPPCATTETDDEFTETAGFSGTTVTDPRWTCTNCGTTSFTLTNGELAFTPQNNNAAVGIRLVTEVSPTTPWTYVLVANLNGTITNAIQICGIAVSDGTKIEIGDFQVTGAGAWQLAINRYTTTSVFSSSPKASATAFITGEWIYFKLQNDGVNLNYSYSYDGINYGNPFYSEANNAFLANTNNVGFACDVEANTATPTMGIDYFRRTQ